MIFSRLSRAIGRRQVAVAVAALLLLTWQIASLPSVVLEAAEPTQTATQARPGAFSIEGASVHLWTLSNSIGSRPAGSPAYDDATSYVAEFWRSLGHNPVVTPFQFNAFTKREVSLTFLESGERVSGTILRGGDARGDVSAPLVDAGSGRASDLPPGLSGSIALIRRGEIRFSEKVENVAAVGALGAVIENDQPDGFIGTLTGAAPIPAIGISGEDGQRVRAAMARGETAARLLADGGSQEISASNVSMSQPGTGAGIVFVGAHLDSVAAGPGANDNGSGSAIVTELGRSILGRSYPFEVRLVLFGAEEVGLIGSARYVAALSESDRTRALAMINLDMVGVGSQWRVGGTSQLVSQAQDVFTDLGDSASRMGGSLSSASDHSSFMDAGIPSVFLYRSEDPNYHTAGDRPEYVDPENLELAGNVVLTMLDRLAAAAPL